MTPAECLHRILLFEKPEYIPNYENVALGPRLENEWHGQGLPAGVSIDEYFGFVKPIFWYGWVGRGKYEPIPGVAGQGILATEEESTVYRDCWGRETRWYSGESMSEGAHAVLKESIVSRADWDLFKDQFRSDDPWRYPGSYDATRAAQCYPAIAWHPESYQGETTTYEDLKRIAESGEQLIQMTAPSMFGELKELMGYENLCVALYDDPDLVRDMIETRTELALTVMETVLDRVSFPMLHFWEDMAFRSGPLVSPEMFEEFALPGYRRIVDLFRSKGGEIISLDSDGDIRKLIPMWTKGGINHFWPMEVQANMDVVALRSEFGHEFTMRGGIDKTVLLRGTDEMRRELERVAPVVEDGGYMPMIDHSVPTGVTFENFCIYMELKREILGIR